MQNLADPFWELACHVQNPSLGMGVENSHGINCVGCRHIYLYIHVWRHDSESRQIWNEEGWAFVEPVYSADLRTPEVWVGKKNPSPLVP